jgi:small subunit ribosomal protein S28e
MARGSGKSKKEQSNAATDKWHGAIPAEVVEIVGKIKTKQGGMQVRCKLLEGREEGKVMRRNVLGPTKIGDVLMLLETEIEARSTEKGRRG